MEMWKIRLVLAIPLIVGVGMFAFSLAIGHAHATGPCAMGGESCANRL